MDITTLIAGAVAIGSLAGGLGLTLGRASAKPAPTPPRLHFSPTLTTASGTEGHVHSAVTSTAQGWFCECGLHCHVFFRDVEGEDYKLCECGEQGIGKAWA